MEGLSDSYTDFAAAFGDETKYDNLLSVSFHYVGEYDKPASEGQWVEDEKNPDKAIFKKGTLTQLMWIKGQTFPRSHVAGERPVFNKKTYIRIATPGDPFTVIDKEATDIYKVRFAKPYEAFLRGDDQHSAQGRVLTLLVPLGILEVQIVEEMKYWNIYTCEQLCGVSKSVFPGFSEIQTKVRAFLASLNAPADAEQLRRERDELLARVSALEAVAQARQGQGKPKGA